jgi:hypothetical protein
MPAAAVPATAASRYLSARLTGARGPSIGWSMAGGRFPRGRAELDDDAVAFVAPPGRGASINSDLASHGARI